MADDSENLVTLVLPILIGFVGGVLSAFVSWIRERAVMARENREMKIKMSTELCRKIIDSLDAIYARMNNDAWHIAWRKATEQKFTYPEELVKQDEERWEKYIVCLDEWRSRLIGYETECKGFFGSTGYEAFLFLSCADLVERLAEQVWTVYYSPRLCISETDAIPTYLWKDGKAIVRKDILDTSEDGQRQDMELYFQQMETLKDRIAALSSTMIHCIQIMSVGNLADATVPVPEEDREEAEALLGGKVYECSYESHKPLKEKLFGDKVDDSGTAKSSTELPV